MERRTSEISIVQQDQCFSKIESAIYLMKNKFFWLIDACNNYEKKVIGTMGKLRERVNTPKTRDFWKTTYANHIGLGTGLVDISRGILVSYISRDYLPPFTFLSSFPPLILHSLSSYFVLNTSHFNPCLYCSPTPLVFCLLSSICCSVYMSVYLSYLWPLRSSYT